MKRYKMGLQKSLFANPTLRMARMLILARLSAAFETFNHHIIQSRKPNEKAGNI